MQSKTSKNGGDNCRRYTLMILHCFFLVVGVVLIMLGVFLYSVPGTQSVIQVTTEATTSRQVHQVSLVTMVTGGCVVFISLLGCYGALNNNRCILMTIAVIFTVVLVVECALAAFGIMFQSQIALKVTDQMTISLSLYEGDDATDANSVAWREIQTFFKCCGVNTAEGFHNHTNINVSTSGNYTIGSAWYRNIGMLVNQSWPGSCCELDRVGEVSNPAVCYTDNENNTELHKQGCLDQVVQFLQRHLLTITLLAILLFVTQIVAIILSCQLFKNLKSSGFKPV
uniref:Tetraspanin n=1 Tax=Ciona intestinalis TaxID=7719 RepID=H2XWM4_CIOIN|nr:CD63 antigen [Ciona intestinalis]|eukprot:XP_002131535.1 CD63 antigen [Ciona intestinalis]